MATQKLHYRSWRRPYNRPDLTKVGRTLAYPGALVDQDRLKSESTAKELKMQFRPIKTAVFIRVEVHSRSEAALMYSRLLVG